MRIQNVKIRNFRLLRSVEVNLESDTTVIVGRNNSGKTSMAELFRRFLETSPKFALEDFSLGAHEQFWTALTLQKSGADATAVRSALPVIEAEIAIQYDVNAPDLGPLTDFIVDLNPSCTTSIVAIRYEPAEGAVAALLAENPSDSDKPEADRRHMFFRAIRDRIGKHYRAYLWAVDPGDATNRKALEWPRLRALLQSGFINAQRGLDDTTDRDNDVLGKILEVLFKTAQSDTATQGDKEIATKLEVAVQGVQEGIDKTFSEQLDVLLDVFQLFGYPGLPDPKLRTETILGVEKLLRDHTKIRYSGANGVHLPEAYNGLGARNLIFILLKLLEFFKAYQAAQPAPGVHLIFIEEPEAHLHPQMQEVFITKLSEIASLFATTYNKGIPWPVQFIVSTHSSHLSNKAPFRATRYFLSTPEGQGVYKTKIKDLGKGFGGSLKEDEEFLHQYMTLTRCDLLFADKAVLIEGTTERLLLPRIIEKLDSEGAGAPQLGNQYVSVLEVGGAYAHRFFKLLDFLELKSLIITDLDSVDTSGEACKVSVGVRTSNACINEWFGGATITLADIRLKNDMEKTKGIRRIAFQIPEGAGIRDAATPPSFEATGRSFEDAFMLANPTLFSIAGGDAESTESDAWEKATRVKKSKFALTYAIEENGWAVPRYIKEGLRWLASDGAPTPAPAAVAAPQAATETIAIAAT